MIAPTDQDSTAVFWTWRRMLERTRLEWPEPDALIVCPACGYEGMDIDDTRAAVTCPACGMTIFESDE